MVHYSWRLRIASSIFSITMRRPLCTYEKKNKKKIANIQPMNVAHWCKVKNINYLASIIKLHTYSANSRKSNKFEAKPYNALRIQKIFAEPYASLYHFFLSNVAENTPKLHINKKVAHILRNGWYHLTIATSKSDIAMF